MEIIISIGGFFGTIFLGVIGYFLNRTMKELEDVKQTAYDTKSKLAVIESEIGRAHV
jgi:hypothetical protein